MKNTIFGAVMLCCLTVAGLSAQKAQMRFADLDTNGDGVISRSEWRGSEQAFRNHDWNGDGRLSGDEVRPAGRRPPGTAAQDPYDAVDEIDDWSPENFARLDHNRDGRVSRTEWHASRELFTRLDRDRDG